MNAIVRFGIVLLVALVVATVVSVRADEPPNSLGFVVPVGHLPQSSALKCADGVHSVQEYHNARGVWSREIPPRDFGTPVAVGRWFGGAQHTDVLYRWRTTDDFVEIFDIVSGELCSATPVALHFAGFGPRADIEVGTLRD